MELTPAAGGGALKMAALSILEGGESRWSWKMHWCTTDGLFRGLTVYLHQASALTSSSSSSASPSSSFCNHAWASKQRSFHVFPSPVNLWLQSSGNPAWSSCGRPPRDPTWATMSWTLSRYPLIFPARPPERFMLCFTSQPCGEEPISKGRQNPELCRTSQVDWRNWRDVRFPQLLIQNEFEETFSFSASFPGQNFIKLFKCCSTTLTPQPSKTLESGFFSFFFSSSRQLHFSKCTLLPDLLMYDNPSHKPLSVFMMTFCVLLIFQRVSVPLSRLSLRCSSPFVPRWTAPFKISFWHFLVNIRRWDQTCLWVQLRR